METSKKNVQENWTPNSARMSFFRAPVTNKRPCATVTLVDIYDKLRGTSYKERTCALRTLSIKKDIFDYKGEHFDYVSFSGTFSYGNDASLMEHSQLICLDFDDIDDVTALRRTLLSDPYFETLLMFTSPSGRGVKWVIHIDTSLRDHREWFRLLESYLAETYQLTVDPKCINVSRACYLPYDPEAYICPALLQEVIESFPDAESRDKMLLGAITTFAGAMPSVFGVYDRRRVYPPFYLLIDAPAASDKGHLSACRKLLMPIEDEIQAQNRMDREAYQQEQATYQNQSKSVKATMAEPEEPVYRSLFIAANSSSTATYEDLAANDGWGLTLETEADTMTGAMKTDYGDYSSGLRAAFHHEPICYSRRKDKEHVNIPLPRWSVLLTCTPSQIPALLPSCENGLASRFVFYNMSRRLFWRDVFEQSGETLDERYLRTGKSYLSLYHALEKREKHPLQFVLSDTQKAQFNTYFESMQLEQVHIYGDDLIAFVRRLGLVCFRIAMILTVLRRAGQEPLIDPLSQTLVCSEEDFQTAMTIIDSLVNHTIYVYSHLIAHEVPKLLKTTAKLTDKEKALYHALGDTFTTSEYQEAAKALNISLRTAERYIGAFCQKHKIAQRISQGRYTKKAA